MDNEAVIRKALRESIIWHDPHSCGTMGCDGNHVTGSVASAALDTLIAERDEARRLYGIGAFLAEGDEDSALIAAHKRIASLEARLNEAREALRLVAEACERFADKPLPTQTYFRVRGLLASISDTEGVDDA